MKSSRASTRSPMTAVRIPLLITLGLPFTASAQDHNIKQPVVEIERQLTEGSFEVLNIVPSRGLPSERTYQLTVKVDDGAIAQWKIAPAPEGGEAFNNRPQYEVAAYVLQKLFLDEPEYVVPPTAARCFPLDYVEGLIAMAPGNPNPVQQTFNEWRMTLTVLQYWLQAVEVATQDVIRDRDRFDEDEVFARHAANFNLLTYLMRHNDSNDGNFLISLDPANPRIFSIDNGLAFSNEESNRGFYWRDLRFDRFPAKAIERLRQVTLEGLQLTLGVVAQFELRGGEFVPVEPTENLDPDKGIRHTESVVQLGLSASEIRNVNRRLAQLLEQIDSGRYEVF